MKRAETRVSMARTARNAVEPTNDTRANAQRNARAAKKLNHSAKYAIKKEIHPFFRCLAREESKAMGRARVGPWSNDRGRKTAPRRKETPAASAPHFLSTSKAGVLTLPVRAWLQRERV